MNILREYAVPGRWCLHAYYTTRPQAPDGSGRMLVAGADLARGVGAVYVLAPDGRVLDTFGEHPVESNFFHTGFWQTWSPDAKAVYYQGGSLTHPRVARRRLVDGASVDQPGDMEGAPPDGEPIVSGLLGMLYAAGYGTGVYDPALAPEPFEARERHGLFSYGFDPATSRLALSVRTMLDNHPDRAMLEETDRALSKRNGTPAGLTLMAYCVRWNRDGSRMLFHFGNHCVVRSRGEPKVMGVFTCRRDFSDVRLALELRRGGVHWSWHPDGERLVGYARLPEDADDAPYRLCVVKYDGTGFRKLCDASGGGHPSVSPDNPNVVVTDAGGRLDFWDVAKNRVVASKEFSNTAPGAKEGGRRDPTRVCLHPVFSADGSRVWINAFEGGLTRVVEIATPGV